MKAVHHIEVSSAETMGAFNTVFYTVNLYCPTVIMTRACADSRRMASAGADAAFT